MPTSSSRAIGSRSATRRPQRDQSPTTRGRVPRRRRPATAARSRRASAESGGRGRRRVPRGPPARAGARVARASTRLPTFAHAISSTNPTAPSITHSAGLTSPVSCSRSGTTSAVQPVLNVGKPPRELRVHAHHVVLRLRHRHAVLHAADHADPAAARRARCRWQTRPATTRPRTCRGSRTRAASRPTTSVGPAVQHDGAVDDARDRRRSAGARADR